MSEPFPINDEELEAACPQPTITPWVNICESFFNPLIERIEKWLSLDVNANGYHEIIKSIELLDQELLEIGCDIQLGDGTGGWTRARTFIEVTTSDNVASNLQNKTAGLLKRLDALRDEMECSFDREENASCDTHDPNEKLDFNFFEFEMGQAVFSDTTPCPRCSRRDEVHNEVMQFRDTELSSLRVDVDSYRAYLRSLSCVFRERGLGDSTTDKPTKVSESSSMDADVKGSFVPASTELVGASQRDADKASDTASRRAKHGHLGISFNDAERTVSRDGFEGQAKFESSNLHWEIFQLLVESRDVYLDVDMLRHAWASANRSDDISDGAICSAFSRLRTLIKVLGLSIKKAPKIGYKLISVANKQEDPLPIKKVTKKPRKSMQEHKIKRSGK